MKVRVDTVMLVVEGEPVWTMDGQLVVGSVEYRWTKQSHLGLLWSMRSEGIWVDFTRDVSGTIELLQVWEGWANKEKHLSHLQRPGPVSPWGTCGNEDWSRHLLMGFEGVGPGTANAIMEQFGGVPLEWRVTEDDLLQVKGVGKKTAASLIAALRKVGDG